MNATTTQAHVLADAAEPYVNTLLLANVLAQAEREKINAIQTQVLSEGQYTGRRLQRGGEPGASFRVTTAEDAWHMTEHDAEAYYARLDAIYAGMGYDLPGPGYCPALIAEDLQTQAEWALIAAAGEHFPECTNDRLLCLGSEKRREYLDLLIGLVVNREGYQAPTISM